MTAFLILLVALAGLRLLTQTLFATGVAGWASLLVTVASFGGNPSDPLGALLLGVCVYSAVAWLRGSRRTRQQQR